MSKHFIFRCSVVQFIALWFAAVPPAFGCSAVSPPFVGPVGDINVTTAAIVDPGAPVTGVVDATGCDAAVYYSPGHSGSVVEATIFGARAVGIINNGSDVTIDGNSIFKIGDDPQTGSQYGDGILVVGENGKGDITHNAIWNFQKNGIMVLQGAKSRILDNVVIGEGPTDRIAQNGIEIGLGAIATVKANTVFGMSYTGTEDAATGDGVIIFGGPCFGGPDQKNVVVADNRLFGNDIGVALNNLDGSCAASDSSATRNSVKGNTIRNNGVFNTSGAGVGVGGYQAGVSVYGNRDQINSNSICGAGYTPVAGPPFLFRVDKSAALHPVVAGNGCKE